MGGKTKNKKVSSRSINEAAKSMSKKQLIFKPSKNVKGHSRSSSKSKLNKKWLIIGAISTIAIIVILVVANHKSYEEYDLKGLTVKEACEKARGAGWRIDSVHHLESYSDKTDCYNEKIVVSNYSYSSDSGSVTIYYGKEGDKKAECEASGKVYRDGRYCKTQEEWDNEDTWSNAHAACKKYGSSGYAKTLTDCYVGGEYKGPVGGEPATEESTSSSSSDSNEEWRQVLSDYEKWMDSYIDFMKRYKNADSSAIGSMLSDYSRLVNEASEWGKKLNDVRGGLSTSDLAEYIQTLARINKKMEELY